MTPAEIAMLVGAMAKVAREHGITHLSVSEDGATIAADFAPAPQPQPIRQNLGPAARMAENFNAQISARQQANASFGDQARMQAQHAAGAAQRAQQRHETMFAATSVRPAFLAPQPPTPESAVPRAVRAKEAAAKGGKPSRKKR